MQTPLGSCGLPARPGAASPACSPFTRRGAAWCWESREKNPQEDGGPLGRKSGAWEQLGDAAGPRQERPLRRGRAAAGTAAPLVLHIPGGNGIFGGRRAPGRNSRAAFGVRPWLSCWDPELQGWCLGSGGLGGVAAPFGLGKASPRIANVPSSRLAAGNSPGGSRGLSPGLKPSLGHCTSCLSFPAAQSCLQGDFGWRCCQQGLQGVSGSACGKQRFPCLPHGRAQGNRVTSAR